MNVFLILTCSFALAASSHREKNIQALVVQAAAGKQSAGEPPNSPAAAKVEPAKEADIRALLEISGARGLMEQSMGRMEQDIKPLLAHSLPPGDYREKLIELFFAKFHAKADMQQLINLIVPIYDRYLSDEEIKGLLSFYRTPVGQKALTVLPKLMVEAQDQGRKWGENMGRQCMTEVMAEHPEFVKEMEEAQKTAHPQ